MKLVHGLELNLVAVDDHLRGASALQAVAGDDAYEPLVGVGVHEHLHVEGVAQHLLGEHQDALDHTHLAGLDVDGLRKAGAGYEVIGWHLHGMALAKLREVVQQQGPVYGGRLVIVLLKALFERYVAVITVVAVLWQHSHLVRRQAIHDAAHNRGFSRAGASGYSYSEHVGFTFNTAKVQKIS